MRRTLALVTTALIVLVATACGGDDTPGGDSAGRRIDVEMQDNVFSPDTIDVQAGETVTFVFTNGGDAVHEAFVGSAADQDEHEMNMDSGHDMGGGDALEVDPGDTAELEHTFDESGEVLVGCHQPGHYEDGMSLTVNVA